MLLKITKASGGLKWVDTVDLLVSLTQMWEQDPSVIKSFNGLRNGQKKAKRVSLPFSDDLLAAITSYSLLKSNYFPKDRPKWDGKIPKDQTLQALEYYFLSLHRALEKQSRLATVCRNAFGSVHPAALVHDISLTTMEPGSHIAGAPASFMDQFYGNFGSL